MGRYQQEGVLPANFDQFAPEKMSRQEAVPVAPNRSKFVE